MYCVYDVETYPNAFTFACVFEPGEVSFVFEISEYQNDSEALLTLLMFLRDSDYKMVGFNNYTFDYPIIHYFIESCGRMWASDAYTLCQKLINGDAFENSIAPWDHHITQIDLMRVHHFNNKTRYTSLKTLEFNMRLDNVSDLPYPPGTLLTREQVENLKEYNLHDVLATRDFFRLSKPMVDFRFQLSTELKTNLLNKSDVGIGEKIATLELSKSGINFCAGGTPRTSIDLNECILSDIDLSHPELARVLNYLRTQIIVETKGVFKGLSAKAYGIEFKFGLGGLHGSIESEVVHSDEENILVDIDVKSYYPNIAIVNGFYPEHLGFEFCKVYKALFEKREQFEKGSVQNAAYKLALNGVYGLSGAPYSNFYDPKFMMSVTLNGQLLLCTLAEYISVIPSLRFIQINTDGITVRLRCSDYEILRRAVATWESTYGFTMDFCNYKTMCIRDVNNYLAVYEDGTVKEKGAYCTAPEWHKDHSALIVQKVAKLHLLHGAKIGETVRMWRDPMDFMLRAKVPRTYHLVTNQDGIDAEQQRTSRYFVSKKGPSLIKKMPPTKRMIAKGKTEWRRNNMQAGRCVTMANDVTSFVRGGNFKQTCDYDYYINEVEKLVLGLC